MRNSFILAALLFGLLACEPAATPDPGTEIAVPEGYSLVWSDEFNQSGIDSNKWQYEIGDGTDYGQVSGWGNNELQLYSEDPAYSGVMEDEGESVAFIKADKVGDEYFSAKLTTKAKLSVRFGRVDVRLKLPKGQGIWPAIWMLGNNIDVINWPGCGEIDIVELLGHEPGKIYSTLHFTNAENKHEEIQASRVLSETFSEGYHVFSLDWTPTTMTMSMDGVQYKEILIREDMKEFLRDFYLIMNVAVGGNWPGNPDASTAFPQNMYVDYVRVFEKTDFVAPEPPVLDLEEESIGQVLEPGLAQHAISDSFTDLGNAKIEVWGGGGEPVISTSALAMDGDSSVVFDFQGGAWGGAYFKLDEPKDLTGYSTLKVLLKMPAALIDAEIKMESPSTNQVVMLKDYSGTEIGEGFIEYTIPLADFDGLDLTSVQIPFSMWNPMDEAGTFISGEVLIDNLHFAN